MLVELEKYISAEKILHSSGKFHIELGLSRIEKFLDLIGSPHKNMKYIHVAGTNGKGSVCSILNACLREAGYNVGLYTSPHIFDYTERIKFNNVPISKEDFADFVFSISKLAEKHNIHLTDFEILTVVMFQYFSSKNPDIVILETGLGGRLDATNVVLDNICSVITKIDFDHTERLGNTLEEIAFEKSGIIKPNCPVVTSQDYKSINNARENNNSLKLGLYNSNLLLDFLALKGDYQKDNLDLAYSVIKNCFPNITDAVIKQALPKVRHIGRFDYYEAKNVLFDGAHNPSGIIQLKLSLDSMFPKTKVQRRFIFGCLKNKDYKNMVNNLFEDDDEIYFYNFDEGRSCNFDDFSAVCKYPSSEFLMKNLVLDDKLTIICGSLYMLSEFYNKIFSI